MHTTNYHSTLIAVASDTKARAGQIPARPGTIAALQYELLAAAPYSLTSDDLLFQVHARRTGIAPDEGARAAFFSRPQACLRCSPLAKTHGFGLHHDAQGRVALVPVESADYANLSQSPEVQVVHAMRTKRG